MAWDGTVHQPVRAVKQVERGVYVSFDCLHSEVFANLTMLGALSARELPCSACSAPSREKIRQTQESINFEDVLGKVREMGKPEEPG